MEASPRHMGLGLVRVEARPRHLGLGLVWRLNFQTSMSEAISKFQGRALIYIVYYFRVWDSDSHHRPLHWGLTVASVRWEVERR